MSKKAIPVTDDTRTLLAILHESALTSANIAELSRLVTFHEDERNGAATFALTSAIEVLSQRAGWLADLASVRLGDEYGARGADANVWFMSPTMAAAIEAASTNQSSNVNANGDQHA